MIIDRVLHVRSSEMDFYDASYRMTQRMFDGSSKWYGYGRDLPVQVKEVLYPSFSKGAYVVTTLNGVVTTALYKSYIFTKSEITGEQFVDLGERYDGDLYLHANKKYVKVDVKPDMFNLFFTKEIGGATVQYYNRKGTEDYRMYLGLESPVMPIADASYIIPVVVDLNAYYKDNPTWNKGLVIEHPDNYIVNNPLVPPPYVQTADVERIPAVTREEEGQTILVTPAMVNITNVRTIHETRYMNYWLGYYNGSTPNMLSPQQDKSAHVSTAYTTHEWLQSSIRIEKGTFPATDLISKHTDDGTAYYKLKRDEGTYVYTELTMGDMDEYFDLLEEELLYNVYLPKENKKVYKRIVDDTLVSFTFDNVTVHMDQTLPIVNGFCCYPETDFQVLKATNSLPYLRMPSDFHRGFVLVDFNQVGGCTFKRLSAFQGNLKEFVLSDDLDFSLETKSLLLVIDGRLMLPNDYEIFDNRVAVKLENFTVESELDRKACCREVASINKRLITTTGDRDLFQAPNSFVIVVNKPNFQMVIHKPWFNSVGTTLPYGTETLEASDKNQFDQYARGLLYNTTTRSIADYAREEHTSTFYAEETPAEKAYRTSTVTVSHDRPLVVLEESRDNLMSAKAVFFDQPSYIAHNDQVLWPNWVILDMIFRG